MQRSQYKGERSSSWVTNYSLIGLKNSTKLETQCLGSNPLNSELVGSLFGPHYADDLKTKSSEIEDSLGILISR